MLSQSPLGLLAKKLDSHSMLESDDKSALLNLPHIIRSYPARTLIVRDGEVPGACAILYEGLAYRHKTERSGGRQIIGINFPGDPLDLQHLFLDHADHNVQALTKVTVALVPRPAIRALAADRPAIMQALAVHNQIEASIVREWMLNIGRRHSRERLAHLLCELFIRSKQQGTVSDAGYELPLSQEQLGDALGLTSIHINRTLKALEVEGLIARRSRALQITDWARLKRVAGFTDAYLHLGRQGASAFAPRMS